MVLEAQDNPFTSILMVEAADPEALAGDADPAAGQRRLVVGADHVLYLLSDSGVKTAVGATAVTRASLGLATSDSPEFAALNIGAASDTTLARTGAGELAVEGNRIFRVGGADVPVADGGTGASSASAARTNLGLVPGTDVASLTAGVVPIAQLATGTPDGTKFIRDDGTLQVPPGGGSGALVLLEQHTASASASLNFTSFISSTYDEYKIEIVQLRPATDTASLYVQMGTGGGPTYDTGNNYEWAADGRTSGGAAVTFEGATGLCPVFPTMSNNSGYGFGIASLSLFDPQSTTQRRTITGSIYYVTSTGPAARQAHWGMQYTALGTALTALRFIASSGNITSGTIRIYGVTK